ncbi:hypothetical protein XELAEV_18020093mg [Xenopus laevis]|uniref:Reverse transcriptase zinc-binding domain-containing protein n=1 Tax=Xenopus laevis TaxID=8355 RepID=A0A974D8R3_XENLA|nr:hypothetical protein XELAEV_18020093mg [Xenopus laevis]
MCVNLSKKESLTWVCGEICWGSVLRRYGLCTVGLRKPVCFEAPWFYVRAGRCIRRNGLESVSPEFWYESKRVLSLLDAKEEMEGVDGLTFDESKIVWKNVCNKELTNRQKDLAWMCVKSCLPTRVFQRRRSFINNDKCPRETCGGTEHIPHIFWECGYAKEVKSCLKNLIKGLTDIECLKYEMVMFGLCGLNHDKARVLWFLVNCVKETLWDSRNLYVFKKCEINVNDCTGLVWARLFLYVISDKRKLGYDAEGIWKTKKWKSWFLS